MKRAFTLLELIFIIVMIGILAAFIIPRIKRDPLYMAALQVQSHIRYTQHLAMLDDRYDVNDKNTTGQVKWYKTRWQILFSINAGSATTNGGTAKLAYTIFSDNINNSTGNPNEGEVAIMPGNPSRRMTGGYNTSNALRYWHENFVGIKRMNLEEQYNITNVSFSSTCGSSTRLSFDYLGRPIKGNLRFDTSPYMFGDIITLDCNITLTNAGGKSVVLTVKPETGFVKINY